MTKEQVIDCLIDCQDIVDPEVARIMADALLLEYINDKGVNEAYQEVIRLTGGIL